MDFLTVSDRIDLQVKTDVGEEAMCQKRLKYSLPVSLPDTEQSGRQCGQSCCPPTAATFPPVLAILERLFC